MRRPARLQAEPIRTRKAGWVQLNPDRSAARFGGLSVGLPYGPHDRARCLRERCPVGQNHAVPHPRGTCGFHGAVTDPLSWMLPDAALLDVELFGRVIRHERGWRSSGQRVLGARFVRGCAACLRANSRPVLVSVPSPVSARCALVAPRCRRCADIWRSDAYGRHLTPADVSGLLGTEVSWLDEETTVRILRRQQRLRPRSAEAA